MTRARKILLITLLLVIAGGGGWLAWARWQRAQATGQQYQTEPIRRGDITATIGATGRVNALQSALLAWQTSGEVAVVQVAAGQRVDTNDLLASLDPDSLPSAIARANSDLLAAQQELQALTGSDTALSAARLALVEAEKDLRAAQDARAALDQPRTTRTNLEVAQAGLNQARADLAQAEQAYALVEGLAEDDPVRLQLSALVVSARRQLQNAEWNLAYAQSTPSPAEYERAGAAVFLAQATLEDARREVERLQQGSNDEIAAIQARIEAAQAFIDQQRLLAPFSGVVTEVRSKPGDVVQPGSPAFRLDDLDDMDVVVQVAEVDINRVRPGQPVALVFDAIPGRQYSGSVQEAARTGQVNQGMVQFDVRVHLGSLDELVLPGMTTSVTITVEKAEDALLVPNRAIRTMDGRRVVFIQRAGGIEPVEIITGISGDANSQIVSGDLQAGDAVVLNPPSQTQTGN